MSYRVITGHGLTFEDTVLITPQPQSPDGVQFTRRDYASDGTLHESNMFVVLNWQAGALSTAADYVTLLTQFGLHDSNRNAVTAWLPDRRREWHLYNGWAILPASPNYAFFPQNIRLVINMLTLIG